MPLDLTDPKTWFTGPAKPDPGADGWLRCFRWGAAEPTTIRLDIVVERERAGYAARQAGFALIVRTGGRSYYVRPEDVPTAWRPL